MHTDGRRFHGPHDAEGAPVNRRNATLESPDLLGRIAAPVLACVVLVQAWGLVLSTLKVGTAAGTFLFIGLRWAEPLSIMVERSGMALAVAGCLLAVLARRPSLRLVGALLASAWFTLLAL